MPLYRITAPNGITYETNGPPGATPEQVRDVILRAHPEAAKPAAKVAAPEEKKDPEGFFGAFGRSFREQAGTLSYADEAARYAIKKDEASRKALLEAAKSNAPEGEQGLGAYIGELLGGSAGFMAAPAAAATASAATGVGAPAAPFVGAGVGYTQYTTQNMLRQAQEAERAAQEGRTVPAPSALRAAVAAVPQEVLDVAGAHVFGPLMSRFPMVKNLIVGTAAKKTEEQLIEALSKNTLRDIGGGIVRGVAKDVAFEVPQEIAQQALERWQAGLPLTGKDAAEEYKQAAIGAVVLGGTIGGAEGAITRSHERVQARRALQRREQAAAAGELGVVIPPEGGEEGGGNAAAPTQSVPGGGEPSVPNTGGAGRGEPTAPTAGQTAPVGMGRPSAPPAGAGTGEGYVQPALTDEEQEAAFLNANDERFNARGEYEGAPLGAVPDISEVRDTRAHDAVIQAAKGPEFAGLRITEEDISEAADNLRAYGGDPVTALYDVLERAAMSEEAGRVETPPAPKQTKRDPLQDQKTRALAKIKASEAKGEITPAVAQMMSTLVNNAKTPMEVGDDVLDGWWLRAKEGAPPTSTEPAPTTPSRTEEGLSDEEYDAQQEAFLNANDTRFNAMRKAAGPPQGAFDFGQSAAPKEPVEAAPAPVARNTQGKFDLFGEAQDEDTSVPRLPPELQSKAPTAETPKADEATVRKAERLREIADQQGDLQIENADRGRVSLSDGTGVQLAASRSRGKLGYYLNDPLGAYNGQSLGDTEEEALANLPAAVARGREKILDQVRATELGTGEWQGDAEPVVTDHPDLQRLQRTLDEAGLPLIAGFRRVNNKRNFALFAENEDGSAGKRVRDAAFETFRGLENAVRAAAGQARIESGGQGGARTRGEDTALSPRDAEASANFNPNRTRERIEELTPEERVYRNLGLKAEQLYNVGLLTGAEHAEITKMIRATNADGTKKNNPSVIRVFLDEYTKAKSKAEVRPTNVSSSGTLTLATRGEEGITIAKPAEGVKGKTDVTLDQFLNDIVSDLRDMLADKKRRPTPLPNATESKPTRPAAEKVSPEQGAKDAASSVEGGKVVYQNGNYGLVQGFNAANGQPIYVPFIDGVTAIQEVTRPGGVVEEHPLDVDYAKPGVKLSAQILSELRAQKAALEKAAAKQHAEKPFVVYDPTGVAFSKDFRGTRLEGMISELKALLVPNAKVYFTTMRDVVADGEKFTGPMRTLALLSRDTSSLEGIDGFAQRISDGEYVVAVDHLSPSNSEEFIEILAHELGHVHEEESFRSAPVGIQNQIIAAHKRWLQQQKDKTAIEHMDSMRTYYVSMATSIDDPNMPASALDAYWRSFGEWYADQVSRWAMSAEKPVSIVEKFFQQVGRAIRAIFNTLKARGFLPNETFKQYLELSIEGKGFSSMLKPSPTATALRQRDLNLQEAAFRTQEKSGKSKKNPYAPPDSVQGSIGVSRPLQAMRAMRGTANTDSQEGVTDATRKVIVSRNVKEQNAAISTLVSRVRSLDDALVLIADMSDAAWAKTRDLILGGMTTDQIFSAMLAAGVHPDIVEAIRKAAEGMASRRLVGMRSLSDKAQVWADFIKNNPEGAAALHDLMHFSSLLGVDPLAHATMQDALQNDPKLVELRQNPNRNAAAISKRSEAIRAVYGGVTMGAGQNRIIGWSGLARFGQVRNGLSEAQRLYKMAKESYDAQLERHVDLLKAEIERSGGDEEDRAARLEQLTAQYEEAHKVGVYFPLFRSGQFWVKVGEGANTSFYMFDNETAMKQALRDLRAANPNERVEFGRDVKDFRKEVEGASTMLKNIYGIIDSGNLANASELKDQVWQMYLMTLPEADIRNRFVHRKGTEGFSADALRAFVSHQFSAENQLSRLEFGPLMRNALEAAKSAMDKSDPAYIKADSMIKEVEKRVEAELTTEPQTGWDRAASLGNKAVFLWMLTSPKSALVQLTQLPIVGFPVLASRYGMADVTKTAAKYSAIFNKIAPSRRTVEGADGEVVTDWNDISIKDSPYIQNMQDGPRKAMLEYVWNYMNDRGAYTTTYASDLGSRRMKPSDHYAGKLSSATRSVMNFMTGFFHQAENMSRQIMSLSAAELEYNRLTKDGMAHDAAMKKAAEVAHKLTNEALFDYSNFNKPRYFKSGATKLGTQFLTYPLQMTSFLLRNARGMLNVMDPVQRKEATVKLLGTLGMTWLFAGTVGLPLYSALTGLIDALRDLLGEDDDDGLDKRSTDLWFREKFIPKYFGSDGGLASMLGLSDEQAAMLTRGVRAGFIPTVTGLNFGASTSLDSLWFRDEAPAQTTQEAIMRAGFGVFGPLGSMLLSMGSGIDDIQNGLGERGVEKMVPAIFRGPMVAARLSREGALTPQLAEIKNAEYYTIGKLAGQTLGFGDTEVADIQRSSILAKRMVADVGAKRTKLLTLLDRAYQAYDRNPSDHNSKHIDKLMDDISEYNEKNWFMPITADTLSNSLSGRAKVRAQALEGLIVDKRSMPLVYDIIEGDE